MTASRSTSCCNQCLRYVLFVHTASFLSQQYPCIIASVYNDVR